MRRTTLLFASLLFLFAAAYPQATKAQTRPANFQGQWEWAVYAKSREEVPPMYRNEPLKDVPGASVNLNLKQRGRRLTGEYDASRRFLARLEEGDVDAIIKANTVQLELQSGFGGKVTVRLTLRGNRLHWKTIKSEGEYYFPDHVVLRRVVIKKGRR